MAGSRIRLYGSTSGYVELAAPAVSPDGVLTLPTGTGGFGKTLQVVQGLADAAFSTTATTFTAVTGLSVSITPSNASNKVLVLVNTNMTVNNTDAGARGARMSLFADGNNIIAPDTPSNRTPVFSRGTNADYSTSISRPTIQPMSFALLHSPATTSAVTYDVRVSNTAANGTVYVNRSITDTDDNTYGRSVSTIMAIEVAA